MYVAEKQARIPVKPTLTSYGFNSFIVGNDKKIIFVSYSNTPEPGGAGLIPGWKSLTPADLEELFEYNAPNKRIKKGPSLNEQPIEEESKLVEKNNSIFRFFTPMELDPSFFEREPSFLRDMSGIWKFPSKTLP